MALTDEGIVEACLSSFKERNRYRGVLCKSTRED